MNREEEHEDAILLHETVKQLPPHLYDVVQLHYFKDLPVAEVAVLLGRAGGTVKRQLHEARALLAESLHDIAV